MDIDNSREIVERRINDERHRKLDLRLDAIVVSLIIIGTLIAWALQKMGVI